jgi:hypothetical protein
MLIVNCHGEWVYFTELQWSYWKDAFRVVISEAGMMARRNHEKATDTISNTIGSGVLRAGSVHLVHPRI